jgi:glutamate decarboxylase
VHSALRIIGRRGYDLLIGLGIDKAQQFASMIESAPDFELTSPPVLNLLTYRYVPAAARAALAPPAGQQLSPERRRAVNLALDSLNESIQKEQRAGGKTFVSRTRLESAAHGGQVLSVFRVVLANPLTTVEILGEILEEQRALGERLVVEEGHVFGDGVTVGATPGVAPAEAVEETAGGLPESLPDDFPGRATAHG